MKVLVVLAVSASVLAQTSSQPAATRNVGSMSDLMVKIIYPASDALFYVESRTPETDSQWTALEGQALMVAESANLLMLPGRARDQKQWLTDAVLMREAGAKAYAAARKRDVAAIAAANEDLLESCTSCHKAYRPGYGRPKP